MGPGSILWLEILRLLHESGWPNTADLEKQDVILRWESVLRHRLVDGCLSGG
jgi:hypothetical protein